MKSFNFSEAFTPAGCPPYFSMFVLKGRTYTFDGVVNTHIDFLVVCHYFDKHSNKVYKTFPLSVYKDERVYFL